MLIYSKKSIVTWNKKELSFFWLKKMVHWRIMRLPRPKIKPTFFRFQNWHWMIFVKFELEMPEKVLNFYFFAKKNCILDQMLHKMEELNIGQNLSRARSLSSVEWLLVLRFLEVAIFVQMSFRLKFPRILKNSY